MGWVCGPSKEKLFASMSMYCQVLNFTRHDICLSVIAGLFQKSFDNVLSIYVLVSHLCNWCVWDAIVVKLRWVSYLRTYFPRWRIGPLSGVSCIECH